MSLYVDGFVLPVPKRKLTAYFKIARKAAAIWKDYGALDYKECAGDDLAAPFSLSFPEGIRVRKGETVVFSWITYRSKAHRDRVNAKIMHDPRMAAICDPNSMPFDAKRMLYGGFKVRVTL